MNPTRRGFLSTLTGLAAISPWRIGWGDHSPKSAHDTLPPAATAPIGNPDHLTL